ncbi:hypothetical protein BG000_005338 [Podila horticola]|nr:hypothetical protein BG000_005338 [Podila horticola]
MPTDPLQLQYILKAITDYLSFNDLLSYVLVRHGWNNTYTPILWKDVSTYRSIPTDNVKGWAYQEYFTQDESRQGFLKNAHQTHALTYQHSQSRSILSTTTTNYVNLVDVNYVIDGPIDGLPELTWLIIRSPALRAVSVEAKEFCTARTYYTGMGEEATVEERRLSIKNYLLFWILDSSYQ